MNFTDPSGLAKGWWNDGVGDWFNPFAYIWGRGASLGERIGLGYATLVAPPLDNDRRVFQQKSKLNEILDPKSRAPVDDFARLRLNQINETLEQNTTEAITIVDGAVAQAELASDVFSVFTVTPSLVRGGVSLVPLAKNFAVSLRTRAAAVPLRFSPNGTVTLNPALFSTEPIQTTNPLIFGSKGGEPAKVILSPLAEGLSIFGLDNLPARYAEAEIQAMQSVHKNFGNFGFLIYESDDGAISILRAAATQETKQGLIVPFNEADRVFFTYHVPNRFAKLTPHNFDAETTIFEELTRMLRPSSSGRAFLYSENPICDNCWAVIDQFEVFHPLVDVRAEEGIGRSALKALRALGSQTWVPPGTAP